MKLDEITLVLNDNTLGGVESLVAEMLKEHSELKLITLYNNHGSKLTFGNRAYNLSNNKRNYLRQLKHLCHLKPQGHLIGMLPRSYTMLLLASLYWRFSTPNAVRRYSFLFASEKDLQNNMWKLVIMLLKRFSWGVIVLSEQSKKVMEEVGFLSENIVVLKNYISFPKVANKSKKLNYTLGYVGRLSEEKRYEQIFNAWSTASTSSASFTYLNKDLIVYTGTNIVGQGVDQNVKIRYSNSRYDIYSEIDFLVLFSDFELEPGVIKEAMMSGCIIISTDVGLIRRMTSDYPIHFVETEEELVSKIIEIRSWSLETLHANFKYAQKKSEVYRNGLLLNRIGRAIVDA